MQQEQSLRADIYLLLANLYRQAPSAEVLEFLSTMEIEIAESAMQQAWLALQNAARNADQEQVFDEHHNLFIGIGRGEVMQFGSWHQAGAMMEKPLADLRADLAELGVARQDDVKEPEDHIAALCEVMAMLITDGSCAQQAFFNAHIRTWFESFVTQIEESENGNFYLPVAQLTKAFFTVEQVRFSEDVSAARVQKVEVKNRA